jgi:hypothetical protein
VWVLTEKILKRIGGHFYQQATILLKQLEQMAEENEKEEL